MLPRNRLPVIFDQFPVELSLVSAVSALVTLKTLQILCNKIAELSAVKGETFIAGTLSSAKARMMSERPYSGQHL